MWGSCDRSGGGNVPRFGGGRAGTVAIVGMGTEEWQASTMDPSGGPGGSDPSKTSEERPFGNGACGRTGPAAAGSLKKRDGPEGVTASEAKRDMSV